MTVMDEANPRPRMQIPASLPLGTLILFLVEGVKAIARGE